MSDKSRNTTGASSDRDAAVDRLRSLLERTGFRPLSTRSVLLSLLLGTHPPELAVERLVAFGSSFGIKSGTVRTSLSRMVADGDLTVDDARYRLAERLVERQLQQDAGLLATSPRHGWDGTWWTAVVTAERRTMTERRRFRSSMVGARMGELRPDIWMRPANLPAPVADGMIVTRGDLVQGDAEQLAAELWDLDAVRRDAGAFAAGLDDVDGLLAVDPARHLALAFDVSAATVGFLRREPQLPADLADLRECTELRARYADVNRAFMAALEHVADRA